MPSKAERNKSVLPQFHLLSRQEKLLAANIIITTQNIIEMTMPGAEGFILYRS